MVRCSGESYASSPLKNNVGERCDGIYLKRNMPTWAWTLYAILLVFRVLGSLWGTIVLIMEERGRNSYFSGPWKVLKMMWCRLLRISFWLRYRLLIHWGWRQCGIRCVTRYCQDRVSCLWRKHFVHVETVVKITIECFIRWHNITQYKGVTLPCQESKRFRGNCSPFMLGHPCKEIITHPKYCSFHMSKPPIETSDYWKYILFKD